MSISFGPHAALIAKLQKQVGRLSPQRVAAVAKAYTTGPAAFDALLTHLLKIAEREGRAAGAKLLTSQLLGRVTAALSREDTNLLADESAMAQLRPTAAAAARVLCLLPLALLISDYISEEDFDLAEMYFASAVGRKPYVQRPDLMAPWRWQPAIKGES